MDDLKNISCNTIDKLATELDTISQELWKNPELCFEEKHAHEVLTTFFEKQGFEVEKNYKLSTAFRAVHTKGSGPNVAVLCEYDALPEIGHACGHNLIAEAGAGAAVGIKAAMVAAKMENIGKLTVLGTPAEEGGGGKIDLIKAGAFDDVDAAMMVHPTPVTLAYFAGNMARAGVKVTYKGKASHAAAFPWEGVNALDAAVMAYQAISNLRQQMKPTWRAHGVFTNGGAKPNIIPEEAQLNYYLRTTKTSDLEILKEKATACFEGAAKATGCTVELEWDPKPYANVLSNQPLENSFVENAKRVGVKFADIDPSKNLMGGSTDMGNVSFVVPSIHPIYYFGSDTFNHTRPFTADVGKPEAQPYTLQQAKAMAMTSLDIFFKKDLLTNMRKTFTEDIKSD